MKMLNCPECGLTITDVQKECPKCRTKIENVKEDLKREIDANTESRKKNVKGKNASKQSSKQVKEEMIAAVVQAEEANENAEEVATSVKEEMIAAVVEAEALAALEEEANEEVHLCETCLAPVEDGQNFCQLCGSSVDAIEETVNPLIPKTDEESNKVIAAIGYLLFFFPILCGYYRKSAFAKFHAKQATLLFVSSAVLFVGLVLFGNLINDIFVTHYADASWHHGHGFAGGVFHIYLTWMLYALHLMPFALMIIGIINALQGQKKLLPIIGRFGKKEEITEEVETTE